MSKYSTLVGMDVHARTITCVALITGTGEYKQRKFNNCPTPSEIALWLSALPQPVYCAYESGCTAYALCRGLRELGYDCDIIAISTLPRSAKDKQQKCDKLDARAILREMCNQASEYTLVYVPDEEIEAVRDLARMHGDAVAALKRAKQQLVAFLLRHGYVWNQKTPTGKLKKTWGKDFIGWLDSIRLNDEVAQMTLTSYRDQVERCEEYEKSTRELMGQVAQKERWKPFVDALKRLKGLDTCTALLAACEFGDFDRFASGRRVSAWLGTAPKNNSSAEKEVHGNITKAGNKHLRRALVEGNSAIALRNTSSKKLEAGQVVSPEVERMAKKANDRLLKRYRHLTKDLGKTSNKAKIAVVNEQVRWIWIIGQTVQAEIKQCSEQKVL